MIETLTPTRQLQAAFRGSLGRIRPGLSLLTLLILFPALALAQSSFATSFTPMQTLFTGTVGKAASLIAIVVCGYQFPHAEPGAKKADPLLAGTGPRGSRTQPNAHGGDHLFAVGQDGLKRRRRRYDAGKKGTSGT
jgi:type IV secretory pathway VirB2 component (pilin)